VPAPKPETPTKPAAPAAKKPDAAPLPAAKKPAAAPAPAKKPAAAGAPLKKAAPAASKPAANQAGASTAPKAKAAVVPVKKPARPSKDEEVEEVLLEPVDEDSKGTRGSKVAALRPGEDPFEGLEVPEKMQDGVREQLEKDEEIVWAGRPMLEILLKKAKVARIVGIVMLFVVGGGVTAGFIFSDTVPLGVTLGVGGFFLLLSILCIFAPNLTARYSHKRPCYVVTNQRVIIYQGGWVKTKAYDRRQLMTKMERRDSRWVEGAGDLVFERTVSYTGNDTRGRAGGGGRAGPTKEVEEHGFMDVANVRDVENLIRTTIILRKPTRAEEKADAKVDTAEQKPAAEAPPKKAAASGEGKIKSLRSKASWLTDDEIAEVGLEEEAVTPGGGRELVDDSELPDSLKNSVHNNLYDDETVFWVGRPHQKIVFMRSLGPAALILVICGFMAYIMVFQDTGRKPWWIYAMLGVFVLISLLTPVYFRIRAHLTGYVLTNKRCLVFEPATIGKPKLTVYLPDIVARMRRRNSWVLKGGGDLIFRTVTVIKTTKYVDRRGNDKGSSTSVTNYHYGFMAIDNVGRVEKLLVDRLIQPYLDRVHGVE
jgi:hypothetical protein